MAKDEDKTEEIEEEAGEEQNENQRDSCKPRQSQSLQLYDRSLKKISNHDTGKNRRQHLPKADDDHKACDKYDAKDNDLGVGEGAFKPRGQQIH